VVANTAATCFPLSERDIRIMSLSLDEEVRLWNSNTEREKYESMATLFGIIVALDYLERAYVRAAISATDYAPKCVQLLGRYKTMWSLVSGKDWVGGDVEEFMKRYRVRVDLDLSRNLEKSIQPDNSLLTSFQMDNPAALHRLRVGVPATVEHASEGEVQTTKWVAETTQVGAFYLLRLLENQSSYTRHYFDYNTNSTYILQSFINFMDAIKLKYRAKDQLHSMLAELMTSYARFKGNKELEGHGKMVSWLAS
jgi:ESCRT-I complex subunit VPS28